MVKGGRYYCVVRIWLFIMSQVLKLKECTNEGKDKSANAIDSECSRIWKNGGLVGYSLFWPRADQGIYDISPAE